MVESILNVAQADDLVIMPAMDDPPIVLVSESQAGLPADLLACLRPIVVRSAARLDAVLRGGFAGWRAYRDDVGRGTIDGEDL